MVKDIKLVPVTTGVYDWDFINNELHVVTGDEQLKNSIIAKINTLKSEVDTEVYSTQGSDLYQYLKVKRTDHVLLLIQETINSMCKEYEEVLNSSVEYVEVNDILKVDIILLKKDGQELVIDGVTF